MSHNASFLLFDHSAERSEKVRGKLRSKGLNADHADLTAELDEQRLRSVDVAVVVLDRSDPEALSGDVQTVLKKLADQSVATVVWGAPDNARPMAAPLVDYLPGDVSIDEVVGRLKMAARYGPILKRLDRELHHLQRLGLQLNRYFSEIDQEMRLAGRLQRDFLPRNIPNIPPVSFATLYRPASWVSGDMFDIFRIDERHIGVFLADAMGHGIAAGLLTMFMRQVLVTKRVKGDEYEVIPPGQAMAHLHESLLRQELPNCQFVTAVYGVIDLTRLELRLARGGHPYAVRMTAEGEVSELSCEGPLLGLADMAPEFSEASVHLDPGDKVLLYSDGLESALFCGPREPDCPPPFADELRAWAKLGSDEFVQALGEHLDRSEGSLHPADDVSAIVLEIA